MASPARTHQGRIACPAPGVAAPDTGRKTGVGIGVDSGDLFSGRGGRVTCTAVGVALDGGISLEEVGVGRLGVSTTVGVLRGGGVS